MMSSNQKYTTLGRICADEHEGDSVDNRPDAKRKRMRRMPSFASVISGAVAAEKIQKICLTLEPAFRKAVHEELERSLSKHGHLLYTAPSLPVNEVDASPSLKLAFTRPLLLPIFTNNKLVDIENNPLEVWLLDMRTNYMANTTHLLGSPIKLEVLVLDGDFRYEDSCEAGWTSDEFSGAIVREREGRRPLLVGTLNVTLSDHGVAIIDDVSFTDNSSWIRSRRFRIGARAVGGSYRGPRIREAVSQSFMVKDHRGELYKKHFPPRLTDEIWRLENIRKEGPIHKRLESEEIKNVQDFLKLHTFNPEKLKRLVGVSDRQWKAIVNHAKTCDMGGKSYIFRQEECGVTLTLNPAGEVMAARIGDKTFSLEELHPQQMFQVKQLALQAYQQWDQLEEAATSRIVSDARNGLVTSGNLDLAQMSMPGSSSQLQLSESQDVSISSGGPHESTTSYLDTMGGAAMTSNSTAADIGAAYWNPCMESDDGLIIWNSSSVWDQVD